MGNPTFDALVVGDGPAGLAAAIALLERRLSVVMLSSPRPDQTPRAEMLPPAAEPIIARLGIVDILDEAVALRPALGLWSTTRPTLAAHAFTAHRPEISIDRRVLSAHMHRRVKAMGGHFHACRMRRVSGTPGDWRVATGSGRSLSARYAIDATGRPAHLARRLGARLWVGAPLVARTFFQPERLRPQLVIEATANGWWYALPLPCGSTVGFLSDADTAPERPTLMPLPDGFSEQAKSLDARNTVLSPCTGTGWLAAGDAATAFDPIASQGLFNALSGGFFAGNAAADVLAGQPEALTVYADLVSRTAARTHHAIPQHYATAVGHSDFWRRRRAYEALPSASRSARQERNDGKQLNLFLPKEGCK